jgi:diguanylate cyclase (GGDEF)-like protein
VQSVLRRYAEGLPRRLKALSERLRSLGKNPDDTEGLADTIDEAHRLAGSAGSYGFIEVSRLGKHIEAALRQLRGKNRPEPTTLEQLSRQAEALAATVTTQPGTRNERERRAKLLVLDDDSEFLWVVRELGDRLLIDVRCATSAEEALSRARIERLDGAILDVWLGEDRKSFDLARELRETPNNQDLPIAFTSADESPDNRVAAARAGAALFLTKPITESSLADAASQLTSLRRADMGRVLIVDDDEDFLAVVRDLLERVNLQAEILSDPARVLRTLDTVDPEALVLDVNMPGLNGIDVCRILRTNPRWQDLPILIVTALDDREQRMAAFQAGCDAFISKPIDAHEFRAIVSSSVDRRRLLNARLERDALTGLPLRRNFTERLRSRMSEAFRKSLPIAVCLIDLDRFKNVNDTYGHLAGDRVLLVLGRLLSTRFRDEDLRSRWGGEEFALAFPGEPAERIKGGVEAVLRELESLEFRGDDGRSFRVTFSAGLAEYPRDGATVEALLRSADARLYQAKSEGRGRVV